MTACDAKQLPASCERDAQVIAVHLRDVHKSFGSVEAVRGVDLTIASGEVLAFLGPNGAGKTSTIDMMLGLSQPSAGEVEVYGMTPRRAITKGLVSAVMQTGGLLKDLTVAETVQYTSKLFAVSRPVRRGDGSGWHFAHRGPLGREVLRRRATTPPLCHGAVARPGTAPPRRADPGNGRRGSTRFLAGDP